MPTRIDRYLLRSRAPQAATVAWPDSVRLTIDGKQAHDAELDVDGEKYDLPLNSPESERFEVGEFYIGAKFESFEPSAKAHGQTELLVLTEIALNSFPHDELD